MQKSSKYVFIKIIVYLLFIQLNTLSYIYIYIYILVNIVHRLAFSLKFNLIIHHYYTYIIAYSLVHLSVLELAPIDLTLVCSILTKGTGVPENYVF